MPQELVPIRFAKTILQVVEAQGYDVAQVLTSLGIGYNPLTDTDVPDLIPAPLYNRIYNRVMWLLQDESFGLHLNERIPAGTFRMMCMCIIHCPTLKEAMERAAEFNSFCRNLTGLGPLHFDPITVAGDIATSHIPDSKPLFRTDNIMGVAYTISIWRRFSSWLIGRNIEPLEILFKNPQPARMEPLLEMFPYPLHFNQPTNGFTFAAHYVNAPLIHTEESLKEFLRASPYHLIAKGLDEDDDLLSQMRRLVGNDFSKDFPSVTAVAEQMHMSVRTLRRRLAKEGLTFQQFKDNTRMNAATQLLSRPELKINAVSALMGFDEPSAFHRSFKKWTGITPGEYRASLDLNSPR